MDPLKDISRLYLLIRNEERNVLGNTLLEICIETRQIDAAQATSNMLNQSAATVAPFVPVAAGSALPWTFSSV